jgi:hypothetical protein
MSPGRKPERSLRYVAISKRLDEASKVFGTKEAKASEIARILCTEDGTRPNSYVLRRLINSIRHYL